jgi:hypothetical protein
MYQGGRVANRNCLQSSKIFSGFNKCLMVIKANNLNIYKGFMLKDEYKGKNLFIYKDAEKETFTKDRVLFRNNRK